MRIIGIAGVVALLATLPGCERPETTATPPVALSVTGALKITMLDLGTLGGGGSRALEINQLGQVVGNAGTASGESHAFMWDGTMHDLGTLGGPFSAVAGINEAGQIAGSSLLPGGTTCGVSIPVPPGCRAFFWDGTMHNLGTLGGQYSAAIAITENGHVAGTSTIATGERRAFYWDGVTMHNLGTLGGDMSHAWAANERGRVVGISTTSSGETHAFLWTAAHGMRDLGTFGGPVSQALAINARGEITGSAYTSSVGDPHAFFWDGYTLGDIHGLPGDESVGRAINKWGDVVGSAHTSPGGIGDDHPFLWNAEHGMRSLGTLGGVDGHAHAVNRLTQVVGAAGVDGQSCTAPGGCNAFFWDGVMHDLGHLGAFGPGGQGSSIALDLNTKGQIVGWSLTSDREPRAVLWTVKY
jgi:probable HAF family extracellular repeat protein